jgi:hypothetical protein
MIIRFSRQAAWLAACLALLPSLLAAEPWQRHTIDRSSRGADGVRLADANGDGRLDIATGWEEGGVIRVYLNPGPEKVRAAWPQVTVGRVKSPEDAVLVDLDGDGRMDVVSCCEGGERTVFVHWAPAARSDYLDPGAWKTTALPVTAGRQMWMYAVPGQIDGRHGVDLLVGSKGNGATVGWLEAPADARDLEAWKFHPLYKAGWIMSLVARDLDADGDLDVIVSDRKGPSRGLLWLEHPGRERVTADWSTHRIGADGLEVMFLDVGHLDGDRHEDILLSTRNSRMLAFYRVPGEGVTWRSEPIPNPHGTPLGKAVAIADLDGDGHADIVHDTNTGGDRSHPGVTWLTRGTSATGPWTVKDISGTEGVKFDLLATIDLDGDGDLDVVGCEERDNLGVFWYENPLGK